MGSFVSKRELGLLEGGNDESQFTSTPPVTSSVPRHFLPAELDPRSPSVGIERTPIPVSTPQETVADPRSPTIGIVRTPITSLPTETGDVSVDTIPVPVSECEDHEPSESSPIPQFLRSELDNSEVCDDVTACVPVCSDSPKSKGTSGAVSADEKLSGNSRVSYAVSPAGSSKVSMSSSTGQRSPLAPRNFVAPPRGSSTPRDIILRKQLAQVEKLRAVDAPTSEPLTNKRLHQQLQSSFDKENL